MLVSVKERTREFGIRKALGATPASILRLALAEATVLTLLAGYLGVVVGVVELVSLGARGASGPLGAPSVDLSAALTAMLLIGVAEIVAGLAPARHAARIRPVEALRGSRLPRAGTPARGGWQPCHIRFD